MYPSGLASASRNRCEYVIESVRYKGVFLWLDGSGMDKPKPSGGGVVNCQTEVRKFNISIENEYGPHVQVSVVSVDCPNLRIRLEGLNVICLPIPGGFGVVNCQYYNHVEDCPTDYELFQLHDDV